MAMTSLGAQAGLETTILRHHPVSQPPLPQVRLHTGSAADAILQLGPDRWTATTVATRDGGWTRCAAAYATAALLRRRWPGCACRSACRSEATRPGRSRSR